jgi:transcriptional regulator with XRE-family HTH domain
MLKKTAASQIRRARWEQGWSQTELARRANVSLRTIASLEGSSTTRPLGQTVFAVARALNLSPDDLLEKEAS